MPVNSRYRGAAVGLPYSVGGCISPDGWLSLLHGELLARA